MSKSGTPSSRASEAPARLQLIFQVKGNEPTYAIVFGWKSIPEFGWLPSQGLTGCHVSGGLRRFPGVGWGDCN
jgi:hypothetical protein